jgi:hypothetical protein
MAITRNGRRLTVVRVCHWVKKKNTLLLISLIASYFKQVEYTLTIFFV